VFCPWEVVAPGRLLPSHSAGVPNVYNYGSCDALRVCIGIRDSCRMGDAQDDADGHGSHVSGIAAGAPLGGESTGHRGVAYDARIAFFDLGSAIDGTDGFFAVPSDLSQECVAATGLPSTSSLPFRALLLLIFMPVLRPRLQRHILLTSRA
jgi:hypothetical protein